MLVFRIFYRLLAALARLAVRSGHSKDLEILVLRPPDLRTPPPHRPARRQRQRPNPARSDRRSTPPPARSRLDRHPRHLVALAPPTYRPTLDPAPISSPRQTTDPCRTAPFDRTPREGEPDLGPPTYPRRACRPRAQDRVVDRVADPQGQRHRPRHGPLAGYLDRVPALSSRCSV